MIYSIGGWICECVYCSISAKKFINRGFLSGPYCPIYGCGALLVTWLLNPFIDQPILIFFMGLVITSILEYITSWCMEVLFHTKWWDYAKYPLNLNGRICMKNSILFGLMSLVVIYFLHPMTTDFLQSLPIWVGNTITFMFLFGFGYDLIHTTRSLLLRNRTFQELEAAYSELKHRFDQMEEIPGETLKERIQYVLSSTDADDKIISIIQRIKTKLELPKRYQVVRNRLLKAFPNQHIVSSSKETIETFLQTLRNHESDNDSNKE